MTPDGDYSAYCPRPRVIFECRSCGDVRAEDARPCGCDQDERIELCPVCEVTPLDGYPYCSEQCAECARDGIDIAPLRNGQPAPASGPAADWAPERKAAREEFDATVLMEYTVICTTVPGTADYMPEVHMRIPLTGYEGPAPSRLGVEAEARRRISEYLGLDNQRSYDVQVLWPETRPEASVLASIDALMTEAP